MKNHITIWTDEEDKVEAVIDTYSDKTYYIRIDIKADTLINLSLYLNVKQARDLQSQLLNVALNGKYDYRKGEEPNIFTEEYHKGRKEEKGKMINMFPQKDINHIRPSQGEIDDQPPQNI